MKERLNTNVAELRKRARDNIEKGMVTPAYAANVERVCAVLNEALASELVCVLRYKSHYYRAAGIHGHLAAQEFLEHAADEQTHADLLAERISQLGGTPDFNPTRFVARSHTEYKEGGSLREMIQENLVAERIGIESYAEMVRWLGDEDPTSRRILETLLAKEEEHADDLKKLLEGVT